MSSMKLETTVDRHGGPIVLIDNYDSFTYNLFQMIQAQTSLPVKVYRNDAISWEDLLTLKPSRVILSPGPGHPGVEKDFGICKRIIEDAEQLGVPILGVCLGHQGMALHLGGDVISAPEIIHGKTSPVAIEKPSPLLEGLGSPFEAMRYHSLLIDEKKLPDCFEITARETGLGLPMAIQHKTQPLYGVQFHPESIGTPEGALLLKNFLERCQ
ncbi:MAG: aminodeoxychorismate/anthranilate synthase component II [Vampirovibrionales bacterium]|nr:aminodeoxychorismate/anthranilate synthase component II [Vampirovibrionales bacterium]